MHSTHPSPLLGRGRMSLKNSLVAAGVSGLAQVDQAAPPCYYAFEPSIAPAGLQCPEGPKDTWAFLTEPTLTDLAYCVSRWRRHCNGLPTWRDGSHDFVQLILWVGLTVHKNAPPPRGDPSTCLPRATMSLWSTMSRAPKSILPGASSRHSRCSSSASFHQFTVSPSWIANRLASAASLPVPVKGWQTAPIMSGSTLDTS